MKRDQAKAILHEHMDELQEQFGVRHLTLFGSVARDEAGRDSDVDVLVEFDRPPGLFGPSRQVFREHNKVAGRSPATRIMVNSGSLSDTLSKKNPQKSCC